MARSTGLAARRAYELDRQTVLVGAVRGGTKGAAAETRTGTARILTTDLSKYNVIKLVGHGQTSNAAGGYIIEVAHVAEGTTTIGTYAPIGTVTVSGISTTPEVAVSGQQIAALVGAANSGASRCVAIRATAGTGGGGNGVVVPAGTMTIAVMPIE